MSLINKGIYVGPKIYYGSELDLSHYQGLTSLGRLEGVHCSLYVGDCFSLRDLGSLKYIKSSGHFLATAIKTLGSLEEVGDYLNVSFSTHLEDLGTLKRVGNSFLLRECPNIVSLEHVGKDLLLDEYINLRDLGALKHVGGRLSLAGGIRINDFASYRNERLKILEDIELGDLAKYMDHPNWVVRTECLKKLKEIPCS